jgi:hypothetical protein
MATTWRFDKVLEAIEEFEDPRQVLVVHERPCTVMFTFICTCQPVLVLPPARA